MATSGEYHSGFFDTFTTATLSISADGVNAIAETVDVSANRSTVRPGVWPFATVGTFAGLYKIWLTVDGNVVDRAWVYFIAGGINASEVTRSAAILNALLSAQGQLTSISAAGIIALRAALAGVAVQSVNLVDSQGSIVLPLVQGDTYETAAGTGIPFACPNAGLVGWTAELAIDVAGSVVVLTVGSAITDWTLPIYFDMTAAQSAGLPAGIDGTCVLRFTKSGKTHTTTVNGKVTVTTRIG